MLPGLDGTGRLLKQLQRVLEPKFQTAVISYPANEQLGYDALCAKVGHELPRRPHVIVAESFSGPVALRVAADKPHGLKALVLSASFAANPRPSLSNLLGRFVGPWCFRPQVPIWMIRALLAGARAPDELCKAIQDTVAIVDPEVMAFRLREVMKSDATAALLDCPVPIFYLHGTEDRLLGRGALQRLSKTRPDMTVIDVPGPHMLLQAAPETCARHIEAAADSLEWH